MPSFSESLHAWPGDSFPETLKQQMMDLDASVLPLTAAMNQGGQIDESSIAFSVITADETEDAIRAKVGVFFCEVVGGCNCAEDPVVSNMYCEVRVRICRDTGKASFSLAN
jgi:hypothetical protein